MQKHLFCLMGSKFLDQSPGGSCAFIQGWLATTAHLELFFSPLHLLSTTWATPSSQDTF
jgi:hypothetical protein